MNEIFLISNQTATSNNTNSLRETKFNNDVKNTLANSNEINKTNNTSFKYNTIITRNKSYTNKTNALYSPMLMFAITCGIIIKLAIVIRRIILTIPSLPHAWGRMKISLLKFLRKIRISDNWLMQISRNNKNNINAYRHKKYKAKEFV